MDSEAREDLVVVIAGLLGVVLGHMLKRRNAPPAEQVTARFSAISVSSLVAAPRLSRTLGDAMRVDRGNLLAQALLAFATSAALTLFAEDVGRFLPGVVSNSEGASDGS